MNKFIDALYFVHLKRLVQKFERNRGDTEFFLQLLPCYPDDICMVKGKGGEVVPFKPLCLVGIIACDDFKFVLTDEGEEGDANDSFTWVSIYRTERMELLKIDIMDVGLFTQFSFCAVFYSLVHVKESTRQSPRAFVWVYATFYQKYVYACAVKSKNYTICGNGWMWIFICVHKMILNFMLQRYCVKMTQQNLFA